MGWSKRLWQCPFYKNDYPDEVRCEGGRIRLPTKQATREYAGRYCAGKWETCTIARALEQYYAEKED